MTKLIVVLTAAAGAALLTPSPAAANCGAEYMACINDNWNLQEPFLSMADLSCGAAYIGCLRREALGL